MLSFFLGGARHRSGVHQQLGSQDLIQNVPRCCLWPVDTYVDVNNEFMPAGQGVGAIKSLIPAGDLVRQIMAEAEQVIDLMKKFAK